MDLFSIEAFTNIFYGFIILWGILSAIQQWNIYLDNKSESMNINNEDVDKMSTTEAIKYLMTGRC